MRVDSRTQCARTESTTACFVGHLPSALALGAKRGGRSAVSTGSVWLRGRESLCHVDGAQWGRGIQLPTSRETRYLLVGKISASNTDPRGELPKRSIKVLDPCLPHQ